MEGNGVHSNDKMQSSPAYTYSICMKCKNNDTSVLKLLPCLHVSCEECIARSRMTLSDKSNNTHAVENENNTLYACETCGHKFSKSVTSNGFSDALKDVPGYLLNGNSNQGRFSSSDHKSKSQDVSEDSETEEGGSTKLPPFNAKSKLDYLTNLVGDLKRKSDNHTESVYSIDRVKAYLGALKIEIETEISKRSQYLVSLVEEQKQRLLKELELSFDANILNYDKMRKTFESELERFHFVEDFVEKLVEGGSEKDIEDYHEDASNVCLHQLHQIPDAKVDVLSMKLDIPKRGKEHSSLEKLFGSLTEGTVLSGSAEMVASFNVDMKWPTSISVSSSKEILITGKTGPFESPGKALFFDGRGRFHSKMDFSWKHVPLDSYPAGDGTMWISNNSGELLNVSAAGRILRTVPSVFKGSGHISVLSDGCLVVASSGEKKLHILSEIGRPVRCVNMPESDPLSPSKLSGTLETKGNGLKLNAIATNSMDEVVIGDSEGGRVIVMDLQARKKFVYPAEVVEDDFDFGPLLKCPSAVCCDPFDNILVADFTNDSVHLFSKVGKYLGNLLTKENGVSCPNCLALDNEGKLYVGQYGGDVLVFRYMSYSKKA